MIKSIMIIVFLTNISFASEKMTFKEFLHQAGEEIKGHYNDAKSYVQETYKKNKQENEENAKVNTAKDVAKKTLDKSMDLTIEAAQATKELIKD